SPSRAQEYFGEALSICREIRDRRGEAGCLTSIGWLHYLQGDLPKAQEAHELALPIRREVKDRRGEALTSAGLGRIYAVQGKLEEALPLLEAAIAIDEKIGSGDLAVHRSWLEEVRNGLKGKRR